MKKGVMGAYGLIVPWDVIEKRKRELYAPPVAGGIPERAHTELRALVHIMGKVNPDAIPLSEYLRVWRLADGEYTRTRDRNAALRVLKDEMLAAAKPYYVKPYAKKKGARREGRGNDGRDPDAAVARHARAVAVRGEGSTA